MSDLIEKLAKSLLDHLDHDDLVIARQGEARSYGRIRQVVTLQVSDLLSLADVEESLRDALRSTDLELYDRDADPA